VVRADRPIADRLSCPRLLVAAAACLALAGCQTLFPKPPPPNPTPPPTADAAPVSPAYPVCFPDVLELEVAGRPECSGARLVYPDGRLDLGPAGEVFAEGCTAAELTRRVADAAGVPAQQVRCRVAAARSRVVYLVGSGATEPRAVAYRGPERATALLRRAGGLPAEVDPDVCVVRRNVARGAPTETFRVDLPAVRRGDARTDVILEPNDELRVADDPGIRLASFLPGRSK
jgi:protein involved in polysaccharide export with SLBB domain